MHLLLLQFITTGYRVEYGFWETLRSLFGLHNETGNVWTHLLGGSPWHTTQTDLHTDLQLQHAGWGRQGMQAVARLLTRHLQS